jgi:HD-GYP domain-containing protein (c-di-GMP phosphodiesterase class II)
MDAGGTRIRLAELAAALSLATDLGMGQPLEQALRTCLLAVTVGRDLGVPDSELRDVYYLALLRFIGCTADAHEEAARVCGDEIAFRAAVAPVMMGATPEYLGFLIRDFATDTPPPIRLRLVARALADGAGGAKRAIVVHCEVARMLAVRIGLPQTVSACFGHVFERWDGKGLPGEVSGAEIPIPARIVTAARDVDIVHRLGGWDAAAEILRRRRKTAYDPAVVDALLAHGQRWLAEIGDASTWETAMAAEPAPRARVAETRLDEVLRAFADFADLKSPYTRGHSSGVAALVEEAAGHAGLSGQEATDLWRAALVHDPGRTGIPNGIWDKPGPLSRIEWERVRLHPYLSERILNYTGALAPLAALAGAHHERLDGSGYHRGVVM